LKSRSKNYKKLLFYVIPLLLSIIFLNIGVKVYLRTEKVMKNYIFIEKRVKIKAQVIKGEWGIFIDFPTYNYDEAKRLLRTREKFEINDSLLAIYGECTSLIIEGGVGGGVSSSLTPIYLLPYKTKDGSFSLNRIEEDGKVYLNYMNEEIVLKPGEKWEIMKTYNKVFDETEVNFIEEIVIKNFGFWKKSDITCFNLIKWWE